MEAMSRRDNHVPMADNITGKLVPMADWIYVEPELMTDKKTASGILLNAPKRQGVPNIGKIFYLGPDVPKDLGLKRYMRVVVNDPNMRGFHLNRKAIVPLKPENVIAIIEEDE